MKQHIVLYKSRVSIVTQLVTTEHTEESIIFMTLKIQTLKAINQEEDQAFSIPSQQDRKTAEKRNSLLFELATVPTQFHAQASQRLFKERLT